MVYNDSMFRESKEHKGSIEGTVKFDKEACCALERGFNLNPKAVEQLKEIVGEKKMKTFSEILPNTEEMKFVPSEEMQTVYGQIAKAELKRMEEQAENDGDLSCGNSIEEHRRALMSVVEKMKPTLN